MSRRFRGRTGSKEWPNGMPCDGKESVNTAAPRELDRVTLCIKTALNHPVAARFRERAPGNDIVGT
jgi:hypothetical protein